MGFAIYNVAELSETQRKLSSKLQSFKRATFL